MAVFVIVVRYHLTLKLLMLLHTLLIHTNNVLNLYSESMLECRREEKKTSLTNIVRETQSATVHLTTLSNRIRSEKKSKPPIQE